MSAVILESALTCPECRHSTTETMPTDACQWFYECEQCHTVLKPKPGDCCVYCSYGTVPCPPVQQRDEGGCCGSSAGANPAKVREALMGGFANSRIPEVHGERMVKRSFNPGPAASCIGRTSIWP